MQCRRNCPPGCLNIAITAVALGFSSAAGSGWWSLFDGPASGAATGPPYDVVGVCEAGYPTCFWILPGARRWPCTRSHARRSLAGSPLGDQTQAPLGVLSRASPEGRRGVSATRRGRDIGTCAAGLLRRRQKVAVLDRPVRHRNRERKSGSHLPPHSSPPRYPPCRSAEGARQSPPDVPRASRTSSPYWASPYGRGSACTLR